MNITLLIIGVTCVISFIAFSNQALLQNLLFYPYRIWKNNEWHRLVSNGFVHADFQHLLFNMISLYFCGQFVEYAFDDVFKIKGRALYVAMYFGAIIIADVFNFFKQKDNYEYRSLGASGGVSAVIFASILFQPFAQFYVPFPVPAFVFGPLYLLFCAYMAKRGTDNIGHLAHFTGAVFGFVFPIILEPRLFTRFISLVGQKIGF